MATAEIRYHVSTAGSLAPSCGCAAQRLRSARHCFRDLLMTLDRRCRYSLSLAFCAQNAVPALRASPPCRMTMRQGGVISALLIRKALRANG